jgi:hypothetical protein
MTGRGSRSTGRRGAAPQPTEDARTRSATEESSQRSQQGDGVGVDPNPGSTIVIPHNLNEDVSINANETVDVSAPMGLARMRQLIDEEALSTDQLQLLGARIRELTALRDGTSQKRPRNDSDDDAVVTKRRTLDLKYDQVEILTQNFTVRQWAQWKEDLELVYDGASWKFSDGRNKITKALSKMNTHCRSLFHSFKTMKPAIMTDYAEFLEWTKSLIKDNANFESSIYDEWENAKQRQEQSPQLFHTYLASLEAQLPKMDENASAQVFKAKLLPTLRGSMMQAGQLSSITTRMAMVNLAQQSWEGMILRGEIRKPSRTTNDEDIHNSRSNGHGTNYKGRGGIRSRGEHDRSNSSNHGGNHGNTSDAAKLPSGNSGGHGRGRGRERYPREFASGMNKKGERICYRCGSNKHLANEHDNQKADDDKTEKSIEPEKKTPTVKAIKTTERKKGQDRLAERVWQMSDSSDSENE